MGDFLLKYRLILIAISVFLILVISVLGVNFYNSFRIETDARLIDKIGNQGALSQKISKSLLQGLNAYSFGQDYDEVLKELDVSTENFNLSLNELIQDEKVLLVDGETVKSTSQIWQPLYKRVKEIQDRIVKERAALESGQVSVRDSLIQLSETAEISTLALEDLIFDLSVEVFDVQGSEIAFVVERHAILATKIEEYVLLLKENYFRGSNIDTLVPELEFNANGLAGAISQYKQGGESAISSSKKIVFDALNTDVELALIEEIEIVFAPLNADINAFLQAVQNESGKSSIPSLFLDVLSYTNANTNKISDQMEGLSGKVGGAINKSANTNRSIQLFGIAGSMICFIYILSLFFGQLRRSDVEVINAQKESERIFETVDQGLFLLDKDAKIGGQFSKELLNIFGTDDVAGVELIKFLKGTISETVLG